MPKSCSERITDMVTFISSIIPVPSCGPGDYLHQSLDERVQYPPTDLQ